MPRTCKTPHDPVSACCTTPLRVANFLPHTELGHLYAFSPLAPFAPAYVWRGEARWAFKPRKVVKPCWHRTHTYAPRLWLYDRSDARDRLGASDQLPRGSSRDEAIAVVRTEELVDHCAGDAGRARAGFEVLRDG